MKSKLKRYASALTLILAASISLHGQNRQKPLSIVEQGSFAIGGAILDVTKSSGDADRRS